MNMRALRLTAVALLGISIGSLASAKEEQPAQQKKDKIICKRQGDADTGSHFASPRKVCRTAAEWKELEDAAASALQGIRDHGGMSGIPTGTGGGPH